MGFLSKIGGAFTGSSGAKAAQSAAMFQYLATQQASQQAKQASDQARADLAPYSEIGLSQALPLLEMLTPEGQADYVENNPLFDAALESANNATLNNRAARGKLRSGGTLDALKDNYLSTAMPLINQQQNSLFNALNLGQSSAAGQANTALTTGNNLSSMALQGGNAIASGITGRAAAHQAGATNILNLGSSLAGSMFSDERLKEDIQRIGEDSSGGIYEFKYIGENQKYIGRIAQDLAKKRPDAISEHESGYFTVSEEFAPRAA